MGMENNMMNSTPTVEKKEKKGFFSTEQMKRLFGIKEKVNNGAIQNLEPKEQSELWDKVKKLAAVAASFGTAVAGGAYAAYEAVLHNGDITSAGMQIAIGAGIAFISAAIGTTMLETS